MHVSLNQFRTGADFFRNLGKWVKSVVNSLTSYIVILVSLKFDFTVNPNGAIIAF